MAECSGASSQQPFSDQHVFEIIVTGKKIELDIGADAPARDLYHGKKTKSPDDARLGWNRSLAFLRTPLA
jgi:hypothetical protein